MAAPPPRSFLTPTPQRLLRDTTTRRSVGRLQNKIISDLGETLRAPTRPHALTLSFSDEFPHRRTPSLLDGRPGTHLAPDGSSHALLLPLSSSSDFGRCRARARRASRADAHDHVVEDLDEDAATHHLVARVVPVAQDADCAQFGDGCLHDRCDAVGCAERVRF